MIEWRDDCARKPHTEYNERISGTRFVSCWCWSRRTSASMARLPDKSENDKDGQDIAKFQITKEILLQYNDAKIDLEE